MNLHQHLRLMSDWHAWASNKLYDIVDQVPETDYRRHTGLFFDSIHGTLNHLILVERMWRGRLVHQPFATRSLRDELESDRDRLKTLFFESARSWRHVVDEWSDDDLSADFTYKNIYGGECTLPRAAIVHTMFTHGSHHRGQISTVLTQLGKEAPVMDYPLFLLELPKEKLSNP
jgi:uncharacterized damage-inducible protein DinB